jgi:hypothetical protein
MEVAYCESKTTLSIRFFSSLFEYGLKYVTASCDISGKEAIPEQITGTPYFIASSGGSPKPSFKVGYMKQKASLYSLSSFASLT